MLLNTKIRREIKKFHKYYHKKMGSEQTESKSNLLSPFLAKHRRAYTIHDDPREIHLSKLRPSLLPLIYRKNKEWLLYFYIRFVIIFDIEMGNGNSPQLAVQEIHSSKRFSLVEMGKDEVNEAN